MTAELKIRTGYATKSEYQEAMTDGLIFPTDDVKKAVDSRDMAELGRLLGPVLLATTAKSAMHHIQSDSIEERKLGTAQVKVIMPFIIPKLEQINHEIGSVTPTIEEYMLKIHQLPASN